MPVDIIERARRYVAKAGPAISGAGGHTHTLLVAKALVKGFALCDADALALLEEWNLGNQEKWSRAELEHKVRSARAGSGPDGYLLRGDEGVSSRPPVAAPAPPRKRREFSIERLQAVAKGKAGQPDLTGLVDLIWLANRSEIDPATVTASSFLERLYDVHREKVVIFSEYKSQGQAIWPEDAVPTSGPDGIWFLAQPVDGKSHPNPRTGKMSRRSEESVIAWRWMVLESDSAPLRLWLAALVRICPRVAAITSSGGRSVHALVRVDAKSKPQWDDIRRRLSGLAVVGADPGALSAVRLTRLPGCLRGDKEQKLLYFSPRAEDLTIEEILPRRDVVAAWKERVRQWGKRGFPAEEVEQIYQGVRHYAKFSPELALACEELSGVLNDV